MIKDQKTAEEKTIYIKNLDRNKDNMMFILIIKYYITWLENWYL